MANVTRTTQVERLDVPPGGRRRRQEGGRGRVVKLRLSDDEFAAVAARAQAAGVSAQRLLLEAALADGTTPAERRAVRTKLASAQRQLVGLGTNVNQLARVANSTGRVPAGTEEALARIAALDDGLAEAVAALLDE